MRHTWPCGRWTRSALTWPLAIRYGRCQHVALKGADASARRGRNGQCRGRGGTRALLDRARSLEELVARQRPQRRRPEITGGSDAQEEARGRLVIGCLK